MKSLPAGYAAHIAAGTTELATALKITRTDGQIYAFTSHDEDAVIDGVTYLSDPGLAVKDIVVAASAAVGNLELMTLHDGTLFTTADIMNGRWRNAAFNIFRYVFSDLAAGVEHLLAGNLGEAQIKQNMVIVELLDLRQYLQQEVGAASSQTCRARLGDTMCRVRLDPPAWAPNTAYTVRTAGDAASGSVVKGHTGSPSAPANRHFKCTTAGASGSSPPAWNSTIGGTTNDGTCVWTTIQALTVNGVLTQVTSGQVFRDSSRAEAADFFAEGTFTITSGDNAGVSSKIKEYAADGTFTLAIPLYGEVAVGNTYTATAGCRKRIEEDCRDDFDNVLNFQGEPHRRGINNLTQAPPTDVSE